MSSGIPWDSVPATTRNAPAFIAACVRTWRAPPMIPATATTRARSRSACVRLGSFARNAVAPTARAMRMDPAWAIEEEPGRDDDRRLEGRMVDEVQLRFQDEEVRRPGDSVDEGDPEQDERGAHRTDDEELRGRLRGLAVLLAERDEGERAEARDLEREEQDEQVRRRGGEHHPDDGEEEQAVVLPLVRFLRVEEASRGEDRQERHEQENRAEEQGEPVDPDPELRR